MNIQKSVVYSRVLVACILTLAMFSTNVIGISAKTEAMDVNDSTNFLAEYNNTPLFADVPENYWARNYIEQIYLAGITGGCGSNPLIYCPEGSVSGAQMAGFLLRGIHGASYIPPTVGLSTGFGDVPVNYWAAAWVKQFAAEGITGGCGNGNYCPDLPVTRAQMAVFLLRSKYGSSYSPPSVGTGTGFGDVPVNHWAAAWIKQLVSEGIAAGCGGINFCPETSVTRAQMAVFMVRTFPQTLGFTAPYKNAPACPTHDPTVWHALWDSKRGCHYDHTHGDDPALANAYFGPAGTLWGGQTISYPFATGASENSMKHSGYKYSVKTPDYHPWPPCGTNDHTDDSQTGNNCIKASRIQYHAIGGTMGTLTRVHSYFMEVLVCKYPTYTECGVIKIGGHADFAQLQAPHYSHRVVRPGGAIDFGDGMVMNFDADGPDLPSTTGEPYIFAIPYSPEEMALRRAYPPRLPEATMDQWSMNDLDCEPRPVGSPCRNSFARFMTQVGDAWNLIDSQNPNNLRWICRGEVGCEYNGSMIGVNELTLRVLQEWQPGGNGFVTLTSYTDRWGNPRFDNVCASVSVDCVPLVINHVPTGYAATSHDGCGCIVFEYDIYFDGKSSDWIKFPN
ncbi:MAG: S-layer homology domain-containing protein [Anaerolineae bacterium]|nr:S-layer homology domain-containing protein [Anaerolineae bacterium]